VLQHFDEGLPDAYGYWGPKRLRNIKPPVASTKPCWWRVVMCIRSRIGSGDGTGWWRTTPANPH